MPVAPNKCQQDAAWPDIGHEEWTHLQKHSDDEASPASCNSGSKSPSKICIGGAALGIVPLESAAVALLVAAVVSSALICIFRRHPPIGIQWHEMVG